jgi:hypothetical protein
MIRHPDIVARHSSDRANSNKPAKDRLSTKRGALPFPPTIRGKGLGVRGCPIATKASVIRKAGEFRSLEEAL